MKLFIISILLCIGLTIANSKQLEEGPETITKSDTNSSPSTESPKPQKRFAMKEIIMYLTPSQIKALNSGEGYITSQPSAQLEAGGLAHEQEYLFHIRHQEELKQENELLQTTKPIEEISKEVPLVPLQKLYDNIKPVEELSNESIDPLSQKVYSKDDVQNIGYLIQKAEQKQLFFPGLESDKAFGRSLAEQESKLGSLSDSWIPINPYSHIKPEDILVKPNQLIQLNHLENSHRNINALPILPHNLEQLVSLDKLNLPLKYASNFEDIRNLHEGVHPLALNNHRELENQKALAEIVAVANSPPVIAHSKITLTKNVPEPTTAFKDVIVPLPILLKNPKILSSSSGKTILQSIPFYFSSIDLDKLHH